ncbi:hypothetical protein [Neptunicella marina]|uniref:Major facilitator superfamily (MFS) profile domain-containing protein n=1 Tax=Neptunicella marina TaxID=2125989 RepID=A0A8J6IUB7_9ALTE|nr:hypothetical protein [Neptunicella marina]MBC3765990.1 hypothetical protein [Neptunicella marina]
MVWVMLFLLGLGMSIAGILITAMWAEVYGTQNLGSIRSLVSSLSILSTALSPVLFGYLLDHHTSVSNLFAILAIYTVLCTLLSFRAYTKLT